MLMLVLVFGTIAHFGAAKTALLGAAVDTAGGTSYTGAEDMATDGTNLFVAGDTDSDVGGQTSPSGAEKIDAVLTKYDGSTGARLFTKLAGGPGNLDTKARSVTMDASGNVFVCGYTDGALSGHTCKL